LTPELIQRLYERHAYAVFRRCRHLLRDEDEARDAMQECFLRLLEDPARFRGESSHATYLFGLATNVCLTRLRNAAARGARWRDALGEALGNGRGSPVAAAEARDLARAILAEADARAAAMAVFHFVDGLPQGEIAALSGCSRVTVNHVLRDFRERARRRAEAP
jgi:RNA polymerase sigma-70 factor (ECF subfamily)